MLRAAEILDLPTPDGRKGTAVLHHYSGNLISMATSFSRKNDNAMFDCVHPDINQALVRVYHTYRNTMIQDIIIVWQTWSISLLELWHVKMS